MAGDDQPLLLTYPVQSTTQEKLALYKGITPFLIGCWPTEARDYAETWACLFEPFEVLGGLPMAAVNSVLKL